MEHIISLFLIGYLILFLLSLLIYFKHNDKIIVLGGLIGIWLLFLYIYKPFNFRRNNNE